MRGSADRAEKHRIGGGDLLVDLGGHRRAGGQEALGADVEALELEPQRQALQHPDRSRYHLVADTIPFDHRDVLAGGSRTLRAGVGNGGWIGHRSANDSASESLSEAKGCYSRHKATTAKE